MLGFCSLLRFIARSSVSGQLYLRICSVQCAMYLTLRCLLSTEGSRSMKTPQSVDQFSEHVKKCSHILNLIIEERFPKFIALNIFSIKVAKCEI